MMNKLHALKKMYECAVNACYAIMVDSKQIEIYTYWMNKAESWSIIYKNI